ncbi:hypothetical protein CUMW_213200 [Citrus unshiu]|uniref:Uncharacterized protein n=2 Tax=Citrus TaxID=2706 RepID=A0A2H5QB26_CITUN|nr:hypothetical protein CUMW_213200 [Citrus unshiu]
MHTPLKGKSVQTYGPKPLCVFRRAPKHELLQAEIEFLQKREIELENESVCPRSKQKWERFQQANMVTGQELNAIRALASRNFFSPAIIEGGGTTYSHPDKKILHLG